MPKRKYELPGIHDLSKEQEEVRALPKEGQHLIIGGPGTGKSVLALIRARRHHGDGDNYLFLVYNHLLLRACRQLYGDLVGETWDVWFRAMFKRITGQSTPVKQPKQNGFKEIDWSRVEGIVDEFPASVDRELPFLVIDEGQDMPPEFYATLVQLGFQHFFVVADQNQQIAEKNSTRTDIQDYLDIEADDVIELRHNYRNCHQVARLASAFYTGDPASPPPDLPAIVLGPALTPVLSTYCEHRFDNIVRSILRMSDRDPRKLIGIIAPNNRVRKRFLDALRSAEVQLDNPPPIIETYHSNHRAEVAFDEGGILVINAQACKGLEFDTVLLADIDEHFVRSDDPDGAKRLFYVMVARAKERVFMFKKRNGRSDIQRILPTDPKQLRREEIQ